MNGWTPTTPAAAQGRNLSAELSKRVGFDSALEIVRSLLQKHNGITPEFIRELGGVVRSEMEKEAHE